MAGEAQTAEIAAEAAGAEGVIRGIAEAIPPIVDWVAIIIFLVGFGKATVAWVLCEFRRGITPRQRHRHIQKIRLALGSYILLGLEIMIISDVVHSCVHPDLMSLAELGALVVVRTVISFFLGKELEQLQPEVELED